MTNSTVSRLGQSNLAGATDALWLKLFGGEVLTEFEKATVFMDKHFVRPISGGKSASFPSIGAATASYHTPGNFIDGQTIGHAETIITIDDLLVSSTFISNWDEAVNHYDVRGPYAAELGRALAYTFDKNVAQMGVLTARATNDLTTRSGGSRIVNASMATDKDVIRAALFTAAQTFDEKNVPQAERWAFFKPAQYWLVAQDLTLINRDYGGSGSIADGTIGTSVGFPIVKTNHLPSTNVATGNAKYQGNFTTTAGLILHRNSVGTVKLIDLAIEQEYEIRRQGHFMVAKIAVGHGKLRPEGAIELATAAL